MLSLFEFMRFYQRRKYLHADEMGILRAEEYC